MQFWVKIPKWIRSSPEFLLKRELKESVKWTSMPKHGGVEFFFFLEPGTTNNLVENCFAFFFFSNFGFLPKLKKKKQKSWRASNQPRFLKILFFITGKREQF